MIRLFRALNRPYLALLVLTVGIVVVGQRMTRESEVVPVQSQNRLTKMLLQNGWQAPPKPGDDEIARIWADRRRKGLSPPEISLESSAEERNAPMVKTESDRPSGAIDKRQDGTS